MRNRFVFGGHDRMRELERRVRGIAQSGLPVLIEGPLGTGKEALAGLIHELSGGPPDWTRVSCLQSGPVASDAVVEPAHIYRNAHGTLFLKNVHLLKREAQEQLLTAVERATHTPESGPRLISSTTESLDRLATDREFSPALYYRLSVYRILLPPLCERAADIAELFKLMTLRFTNGNGGPPAAPPRLVEALTAHDWPGNLRELENIARAYVASGDSEEIIAELSSRRPAPGAPLPAALEGKSLKEQVSGELRKLESDIILRTLERHRWNRRRAAQSLQISYRSLLYKMKNCDLRGKAQAAAGRE